MSLDLTSSQARTSTRRLLASPLTRRILLLNLLAPVLLMVGLFYLDRYKQELITSELDSLRIRAEMMAAALGEGAITESPDDPVRFELIPEVANQMVRRLADHADLRARLFSGAGELLADSRQLGGRGLRVQIEDLPEPEQGGVGGAVRRFGTTLTSWGFADETLPLFVEKRNVSAKDYPEVARALRGSPETSVSRTRRNELILSAAVPVSRYKQVIGSVMVWADGHEVVRSLVEVRLAILQVFAAALMVTVTLSLYLGGTIARPIRRLAAAAERVRRSHGRRHQIPDFSHRDDEIGDLSEAFRDMTEALWSRMDAIEAFAADVAHEIKNPLTSLRSAVETVQLVKDAGQRAKLMGIIQDDVTRLDRLISDISDASRLDAELSRAETSPVEIRPMLEALAEVYRATNEGLRFEVQADGADPLTVPGMEGRLVQVFRNLIGNAISFSPEGGLICLSARRDGSEVVVEVTDDGPGIPDGKLEAIFDRFYTERPSCEKFGTHSGLGLAISKQIVEAHRGRITAANRQGRDGALFTVRLPAAE